MFYCRYCDEEFKDAKTLKKHEKVCDLNPINDQQTYRCNYCHKTFTSKDSLKAHLRNCSFAPKNKKDINFED